MFRPLAASFDEKIGFGLKSNGIHLFNLEVNSSRYFTLRNNAFSKMKQIIWPTWGPCHSAQLRELPDFGAEHILNDIVIYDDTPAPSSSLSVG